jgi:rRNA processing protein Gar1
MTIVLEDAIILAVINGIGYTIGTVFGEVIKKYLLIKPHKHLKKFYRRFNHRKVVRK